MLSKYVREHAADVIETFITLLTPWMMEFHEKTVRDKFAGDALRGELSSQNRDYEWANVTSLSNKCYETADAMMEARKG